ENQQRIAADRAGEDLVDARDVAVDRALERVADLVNRMQRYLRHVEQHAVTRQLGQRGGGAAEPDVQQLDGRMLLSDGELHYAFAPSTSATTFRIAARSTGFVMNPLAPPISAISRDESWTSAETTTTRAARSSSCSLARTSNPGMPRITRSSSTRSG